MARAVDGEGHAGALDRAGGNEGCPDDTCRQPRRLGSTQLDVQVVPHGATLHRLRVLPVGPKGRDVILTHADTSRIGRDPGYIGATVGRYANRLRNGRFVIDGNTYQVEVNEGSHALHGGRHGLDTRCWSVLGHTDDTLSLGLESPDGDQGFPGRLQVTATYAVVGARLTVTYQATTDAATPVSLANHAYFNLEGEGSGTVDDHTLVVVSRAVAAVDHDLIPTGAILTTDHTPVDLSSPRRLGDLTPRSHPSLTETAGLDHCYILATSGGLRRAAVLSVSDLRMTLLTNQPGVQVYGGGRLDGTTYGPAQVKYGARAGVALEAQHLPDAPNHAHFPDAVLRPGHTYVSSTAWQFDRPPLLPPSTLARTQGAARIGRGQRAT